MATLSRRTRLLAVIIVALFGWGAFSLTPYWVDWLLPSAMPPVIDENELGDRILFIAPHPDDESLGAGGLIQRVLARGKKATVVFMTCGDGYRRAAEYAFKTSSPSAADYLRLGWLRRKEALSATSYLGIHPRDVIFLGFPDGGLAAMWNKHWENTDPVRGLNGATRAPYPFAFQAERPYSGTAVVAKLAAILKQYEPTDILYPDPFDQHPDHWATAAFVKYTLVQMNVKPREWTYLVHRGDFPVPWAYTPWRVLVPPRALTRTGVRWEAFLLHPEEEARKREAIHRHASQMRVIGPFLDSFVRRNELLGRFEDPVLPISRDFDPQRSPTPTHMPFTLFQDAVGDTVHREWEGAADIQAVASVRTDRRWYIGIQTREPISQTVTYGVHLRLLRGQAVRRVDCQISDLRTLSPLPPDPQSLPPNTSVSVQHDIIWVSLPVSVLRGIRGWMIEVDTRIGERTVDRSPWRWIQVPEKMF